MTTQLKLVFWLEAMDDEHSMVDEKKMMIIQLDDDVVADIKALPAAEAALAALSEKDGKLYLDALSKKMKLEHRLKEHLAAAGVIISRYLFAPLCKHLQEQP